MTALATSAGNACALLFDVRDRGRHPAVVDGGATTSYEQLVARALAFAGALSDAGISTGDRVAIWLPRTADWAAAFFGTLACGAVAVPVNDLLRPRQVEHVLRHSGASVLVSAPALHESAPRPIESDAAVLDPADVPAQGSFVPVPRTAGDVAQIVYTSGSTGPPKGITVSHANIRAGTESVVSYLGIEPGDRLASLLPFSFDYGQSQMLCAVARGATLVIERSPIAARIVQGLRRREVTVAACVPPLWLQLLGVDAFGEAIPSLRLMTNTGGRLPEPAVRRLRAAQPQADLVLMYGLTEAFRSTYLPPDRVDRKPTSIGRAIPGAEIAIVDSAGARCEPGEVGQLVHRGPTVALGYWDDEDATARVFRPNPLRPPGTPGSERVVYSGDLVCADEEGDLHFVGRADTMIKTLGYRVSPDEVAEVLHASGEVTEAVVTSEPDDLRGESIVAHVVLAEGGDADRLERFVAGELPRYMQPARIEVHAELGRTPSGKHDPGSFARTES